MITLFFYGLDQFVVARLSHELTGELAKLYEVSEDEINFVGTDSMMLHDGVDQTSWNLLIHVHAPLKVTVLQDDVAKLILASIGELAIHKAVEFYYYSQDNRYEEINHEYPRYITDDNQVEVEDYEEDECDDEDCECHHHEEEEDIYTGDIFEDFNKKTN